MQNRRLIEFLLLSGARVDVRDIANMTPAQLSLDPKIQEMLLAENITFPPLTKKSKMVVFFPDHDTASFEACQLLELYGYLSKFYEIKSTKIASFEQLKKVLINQPYGSIDLLMISAHGSPNSIRLGRYSSFFFFW